MSLFFHKLFRCPGLKVPPIAWKNPFKSAPVRCPVCGQLWDCMVEIESASDPGIACWDKAE